MPPIARRRIRHIPRLSPQRPKALRRGKSVELQDPFVVLPVAVELAFLGHALEGFTRTLDAVLMLVAFQRQ